MICEHCNEPASLQISPTQTRGLLLIHKETRELRPFENGDLCENCYDEMMGLVPPNWLVSDTPLSFED